jgi:hypothetical protein
MSPGGSLLLLFNGGVFAVSTPAYVDVTPQGVAAVDVTPYLSTSPLGIASVDISPAATSGPLTPVASVDVEIH